jgi:ribosome production factor 2
MQTSINLAGIDRAIICTAVDKKIHFRHYGIILKGGEAGSKVPTAQLVETGPRMDLNFRRSVSAPDDIRKQAMRVPKTIKPAKEKNMERGAVGEKLGRIHLGKQNFDEIQTRKIKGLKRKRSESQIAEAAVATAGDSSDRSGGRSVSRKSKAPKLGAEDV